jgi:outer membrane protein assembly factor BamB
VSKLVNRTIFVERVSWPVKCRMVGTGAPTYIPTYALSCALAIVVLCNFLQPLFAQEVRIGSENQWPGFRGPNGIGVVTDRNPPLSFDAKTNKNIQWKISLPKQGMSSPIVWGSQVYLTGADEESRQLYSIDADTGKLRWTHDVQGLEDEPSEGTLPKVLDETGYAASTPTTDGRFIAAVFATGELVCVNIKGNRIWSKHLGVPKNHYGHASSLLNDGDRLFVQFDHSLNSKLYAFDFATGKIVWEVERKEIAWSSPILIESNGTRKLIVANSKSVDSYDPKSGKLIWHVDCLAGEVAASPAYSEGIVVVASEGSAATAIDIAAPTDATRIRWQWKESLPDTASPVASGGMVIIPTGFGVVSCLDIKTGKMLWEHQFDTGFSSSPIIVGDKVFLADLTGKLQIFKLSTTFESIGESNLGETIYASPAFASERLFIRCMNHLYGIR